MLLDDFVYEEKLIDDEICDQLVQWYVDNKELQHEACSKNPDTDQNEVRPDVLLATRSWLNGDAWDLLYNSINISVSRYITQTKGWPWQYEIESKDYSIREYQKGEGLFDAHIDTATEKTYNRMVAFILYLNDVEEGGETEFIYTGKKVKPTKGKVLMFPCNYLFPHQGNIPLSNNKLIATAFLYNKL